MKIFPFALGFCLLTMVSFGQEKEKLYDPEADVAQQIESAIEQARSEGKHIFLQFGGNWCGWCYRFHNFCRDDDEISQLVSENFVAAKINYDSKNRNEEIMAKYRYPQRFGFPVFIILDENGTYLHTQNSVYLEEGDGYNRDRVLRFFKQWSPEALDPATYQKK